MHTVKKQSTLHRAIGLPVLVLIGYIAMNFLVSLFVSDAMLVSAIANALTIAVGLVFVLREHKAERSVFGERRKLEMSVFGWAMLLCVFVVFYTFSECLGNFLAVSYPNAGITDVYTSLEERSLWVYLIMAVTVGPIAEEMVFRFGGFRVLRSKLGFWPSYLISALLFTASHGTLMHVPVALALSLFICIIYEYTGMFRYCVIFHILFNLAGILYVFSMPIAIGWQIVGYAFSIVLLVLLYVFREKLFGVYFKKGSLEVFEMYLDDKRKHFGDTDSNDDSDDHADP